MEKRIRVTITKDPTSYKIETLEGFGSDCSNAIETISACIGGTAVAGGEKDHDPDPENFDYITGTM